MDATDELWVINYIPEPNARFMGELIVASDGIKFKSMFENSNKTVVKAIFANVSTFAAAGGHTVYRYSNDKEAHVELPMSEIISVQEMRKFFMNSVHITMKTKEVFIFKYGLLSVKKLIEKIEFYINK